MQGYRSYVHDLDVLLHLSGVEQRIKTQHLADWSLVAKGWDPQGFSANTSFDIVT